MTERDLYWLAGLIEGEGCFTGESSHSGIAFCLAMTDQDIMERVGRLLDLPVYRSFPRVAGAKPMFSCHTTGGRAAGLAMTLFSLLGKRRRAKITKLLKVWRSKKVKQRSWHIGYRGIQWSQKPQPPRPLFYPTGPKKRQEGLEEFMDSRFV